MSLVPQAILETRWRAAMARVQVGSLVFIAPDGTESLARGPQKGPQARFEIKEWGVLNRLVARGDIGLGEDYIAGAWDTDSIENLVAFFLLNLEHFENFAHGNFFNRLGFVLHNALVRRNSVSGSRRNIEAHYDVGNDFYALWLDETMTYSSALYGGADNLADAQRNKYGRILERLEKTRGAVLEIGCGWGGFAEEAARTTLDVTGLTISPAQFGFAKARLGARADIRLEDYRRIGGLYDGIVSIEMFEAVGERYWPAYFRTVAERLRQGGRAVIQTIVIRDDLFAGYRSRSDFIRHYVFPGGMLPSFARFKQEAEAAGLKVRDTFSFGQDYARTLREWSARMGLREADIRALGHDTKFLRNWQFYLGICAAAFAVDRTDVLQVELAHA
ncbi:MAG TPA: cyclopropane-fatty-acyl-phospholipid synthase family protein [Rhizomicrobium sp.]|nr:cyclopropane-fatty-acyl-phospholipid synthase family protein [Rhizomicrobium sp.]